MWNDFITGLQFLSRIRLWPQNSWAEDSFSRSVKWFALVGLMIGLGDGLVWWGVQAFLPHLALSAVLVISHLFWAGGICYDGLMDTADGIFSGRPRERMLEIMKDSHTGAYGAIAGSVALLIRFAFLASISGEMLLAGLILCPVISRWLMVIGITIFPYARPEGLGKAFVKYSGKGSLIFATFLLSIILCGGVYYFGNSVIILLGSGLIWGLCLGAWLTKKLGGLTGDCYGAIAETSELVMLFFLVVEHKNGFI